MKNEHIEYTSVDDLILELERLKAKGYGDYPVCVGSISPIFVSMKEYYYDGGYLVRDATRSPRDFLRSRHGSGMRDGVGMKPHCVTLQSLSVESDTATIDGRTVRDIDPEGWQFLDEMEQEEKDLFKGQIVQYRGSKERDEALGCYPMTAYLDSGESAVGPSAFKAKEALKAVYASAHGGASAG